MSVFKTVALYYNLAQDFDNPNHSLRVLAAFPGVAPVPPLSPSAYGNLRSGHFEFICAKVAVAVTSLWLQ